MTRLLAHPERVIHQETTGPVFIATMSTKRLFDFVLPPSVSVKVSICYKPSAQESGMVSGTEERRRIE